MKKHTKLIAIFIIVITLSNTVMLDEVRASEGAIAIKLAEVTAASGGAAAFGSAALGVVIPILLAAGTAYAGYKIIQNRDVIAKTFYKWFSTASDAVATTINSWVKTIAQSIEAGTITDGDTISIPLDVLNGTKSFVKEYTISYTPGNCTFLEHENVYINSLSGYVKDTKLQQLILNSKAVTTCPIMLITTLSTGAQALYFDNMFVGERQILCIKNNYGKFDFVYLSNQNLINCDVPNYSFYPDYIKKEWTGSDFIYSTGNKSFEALPGANATFNGNVMSGDGWDYTIEYLLPAGSSLIMGNNISITKPLLPEMYNFIASAPTSVIDNPFTDFAGTYTPTISVTDIGDSVLDIPLTPDVVNALNDYIVVKKTNEIELVNSIDPAGLDVVDVPVDNPGILDGIKGFFSGLLDSIIALLTTIADTVTNLPGIISDFWERLWQDLQSLLDAITGIPGAIFNTLQEILAWLFVPSAVYVDTFVQDMELKFKNKAGLLTYPISLVILFLQGVNRLGNSDCVLTIPEIKLKDYVLLKRYEFNFTDYVNRNEFKEFYSVYKQITNYILIIAVVLLAVKKGQEIIRGN